MAQISDATKTTPTQATRGRKEEELGYSGRTVTEFGRTLRLWRKYRGLTVSELAIRAGFGVSGRSYISKLEHGLIQHVSDDRLQLLADALGTTRRDLELRLPPAAVFPLGAEQEAPDTAPTIDDWQTIDRGRRGDFLLGARPSHDEAPSSPSSVESGSRMEEALIPVEVAQAVDATLAHIETRMTALLRQALHYEIRPALLQLLTRRNAEK